MMSELGQGAELFVGTYEEVMSSVINSLSTERREEINAEFARQRGQELGDVDDLTKYHPSRYVRKGFRSMEGAQRFIETMEKNGVEVNANTIVHHGQFLVEIPRNVQFIQLDEREGESEADRDARLRDAVKRMKEQGSAFQAQQGEKIIFMDGEETFSRYASQEYCEIEDPHETEYEDELSQLEHLQPLPMLTKHLDELGRVINKADRMLDDAGLYSEATGQGVVRAMLQDKSAEVSLTSIAAAGTAKAESIMGDVFTEKKFSDDEKKAIRDAFAKLKGSEGESVFLTAKEQTAMQKYTIAAEKLAKKKPEKLSETFSPVELAGLTSLKTSVMTGQASSEAMSRLSQPLITRYITESDVANMAAHLGKGYKRIALMTEAEIAALPADHREKLKEFENLLGKTGQFSNPSPNQNPKYKSVRVMHLDGGRTEVLLDGKRVAHDSETYKAAVRADEEMRHAARLEIARAEKDKFTIPENAHEMFEHQRGGETGASGVSQKLKRKSKMASVRDTDEQRAVRLANAREITNSRSLEVVVHTDDTRRAMRFERSFENLAFSQTKFYEAYTEHLGAAAQLRSEIEGFGRAGVSLTFNQHAALKAAAENAEAILLSVGITSNMEQYNTLMQAFSAIKSTPTGSAIELTGEQRSALSNFTNSLINSSENSGLARQNIINAVGKAGLETRLPVNEQTTPAYHFLEANKDAIMHRAGFDAVQTRTANDAISKIKSGIKNGQNPALTMEEQTLLAQMTAAIGGSSALTGQLHEEEKQAVKHLEKVLKERCDEQQQVSRMFAEIRSDLESVVPKGDNKAALNPSDMDSIQTLEALETDFGMRFTEAPTVDQMFDMQTEFLDRMSAKGYQLVDGRGKIDVESLDKLITDPAFRQAATMGDKAMSETTLDYIAGSFAKERKIWNIKRVNDVARGAAAGFSISTRLLNKASDGEAGEFTATLNYGVRGATYAYRAGKKTYAVVKEKNEAKGLSEKKQKKLEKKKAKKAEKAKKKSKKRKPNTAANAKRKAKREKRDKVEKVISKFFAPVKKVIDLKNRAVNAVLNKLGIGKVTAVLKKVLLRLLKPLLGFAAQAILVIWGALAGLFIIITAVTALFGDDDDEEETVHYSQTMAYLLAEELATENSSWEADLTNYARVFTDRASLQYGTDELFNTEAGSNYDSYLASTALGTAHLREDGGDLYIDAFAGMTGWDRRYWVKVNAYDGILNTQMWTNPNNLDAVYGMMNKPSGNGHTSNVKDILAMIDVMFNGELQGNEHYTDVLAMTPEQIRKASRKTGWDNFKEKVGAFFSNLFGGSDEWTEPELKAGVTSSMLTDYAVGLNQMSHLSRITLNMTFHRSITNEVGRAGGGGSVDIHNQQSYASEFGVCSNPIKQNFYIKYTQATGYPSWHPVLSNSSTEMLDLIHDDTHPFYVSIGNLTDEGERTACYTTGMGANRETWDFAGSNACWVNTHDRTSYESTGFNRTIDEYNEFKIYLGDELFNNPMGRAVDYMEGAFETEYNRIANNYRAAWGGNEKDEFTFDYTTYSTIARRHQEFDGYHDSGVSTSHTITYYYDLKWGENTGSVWVSDNKPCHPIKYDTANTYLNTGAKYKIQDGNWYTYCEIGNAHTTWWGWYNCGSADTNAVCDEITRYNDGDIVAGYGYKGYYSHDVVKIEDDTRVRNCRGHEFEYCGGHVCCTTCGIVYSASNEQMEAAGGFDDERSVTALGFDMVANGWESLKGKWNAEGREALAEGLSITAMAGTTGSRYHGIDPCDTSQEGWQQGSAVTRDVGYNLLIQDGHWAEGDATRRTQIALSGRATRPMRDLFDIDCAFEYGFGEFPIEEDKYTDYEGWSDDNIQQACMKIAADWAEYYNFDLPYELGQKMLAVEDIDAIIASVEAGTTLDETQKSLMHNALSHVGMTHYADSLVQNGTSIVELGYLNQPVKVKGLVSAGLGDTMPEHWLNSTASTPFSFVNYIINCQKDIDYRANNENVPDDFMEDFADFNDSGVRNGKTYNVIPNSAGSAGSGRPEPATVMYHKAVSAGTIDWNSSVNTSEKKLAAKYKSGCGAAIYIGKLTDEVKIFKTTSTTLDAHGNYEESYELTIPAGSEICVQMRQSKNGIGNAYLCYKPAAADDGSTNYANSVLDVHTVPEWVLNPDWRTYKYVYTNPY